MAHKYDKKTPREHVLIRPDTYIGHIELTKEHMWIFQKNKITKKEIKYVPGLYKLFDEIIVNSKDHYENDKTCNIIDITVDEDSFSVMNNGNDGIPIEEHPEHKTLIPTMIFGEMLTSSNYDDTEKRTTGGRNGLGSKCTNIFSTKFEVEIIDNKNKKHFHQIWEDNMSIANKPSIKKSTKKGMCKVTSYPDFKRFKIKNLKNHIPLFHKRAYDLALTTKGKVKVKFNGEEIKIKNLQQYMDLYFPDCDKIIDNNNDRANIGCIYIPDIGYENISFVNGISTFRGGTHCNYICDMIIKSLINDHIKKKNKEVKVSPTLVKENLVFFIDSVIDNPSFISQTKEALTTKADKFGFKYEINKSFITKLSKSGIVQQIVSLAKFKENTALKKTDGKKTTTIKGIPKLEDANKAGTKKSNECSLFLTEGDSAKSMVMSGLSQKDRDFYGVFPLKGKLLNVREASIKQIGGNDEINNLKKILGLKNEFSYEDDKEFETLRYGKIVCLCDQDVDGFHIKGLIINMFHTFWPKLLERKGFVTYMNTPIVKATKGKEVISFYNLSSYEHWKEENDKKNIKGWYIKYYKGLGTSDSKEAKEYFVDIKGSLIGYDGSDVKTSKANIELAFSKELADRRKKWLMDYNKDNILDSDAKTVSVSDFVNKELIHFSNEDNMRSIPSLVDGFKPSQRKILFGAFLRGLEKEQIKVAQLAGFVSDRSAYHHGEASLMGAIIGMAQNFVGSNNINILEPKGQFGCLDPNTDIILWNGQIKKAKDIKINDELVGDDGNKRKVLKLTKGKDTMFKIKTTNNQEYIVNSQHILTLKFINNSKIYWKEHDKSWMMKYFNGKTIKEKKIRTKNSEHFNSSKLSKNEGYLKMIEFKNSLEQKYLDEIIDIKIIDLISIPKCYKKSLNMISNTSNINWDYNKTDIDPYILGIWLGDGNKDGSGITSIDEEVLKEFILFADKINCEVIHNKNGFNHENYHYGIRRKSSGYKISIGDSKHSSKICDGCKTSKKSPIVCDWHFEKLPYKVIYSKYSNGQIRTDTNPFKDLLKKYGLFKNKHIPQQFLINSREVRLQILAGIIDTDGCIKKSKNSEYIEIVQSKYHNLKLINNIEFLAKSLGFSVKRKERDQGFTKDKSRKIIIISLCIYGEKIYEIPTRIPRKKIHKSKNRKTKFHNFVKFEIDNIGKNNFVGWQVDNNERFLLGNFIVTHNSRINGGKDHASPRYIFTKIEKATSLIFRKEDNNILSYVNDDGQQVEPEYYLPIIPMLLVNGATGIGTGFSTNIPCYHPYDIINNIKTMLNEEKPKKIHPYYNKFKGTIKKLDASSYQVKGCYNVDKKNSTVEITELPVGEWTNNYKMFLEKMLDSDANFMNYTNNNTDQDIYMKLKFKKLPTKLDDKLKMNKKINITNLHAYSASGAIKKFTKIQQILDEYYIVRLDGYQRRKDYLLKVYKHIFDIIKFKVKFIKEIVNKTLKINNKKKTVIEENLTDKEYPKLGKTFNDKIISYDYLLGMNLYSLTKEKIEELEKQLDDKKKLYNTLKKKSPQDIWKEELDELEDFLQKNFKFT